jgi:hypothetical protein
MGTSHSLIRLVEGQNRRVIVLFGSHLVDVEAFVAG